MSGGPFGSPEILAEEQSTAEAFAAPEVGMVFQEMASFWMIIIGIHEDGRIATISSPGGHTLPDEGKVQIFRTADEFRAYFGYAKIGGYGMRVTKRRQDVTGWLDVRGGWPKPVEKLIDGRETRPATAIKVFSDSIAQSPYPQQDHCDPGSIWLIKPRWHARNGRHDCYGGPR